MPNTSLNRYSAASSSSSTASSSTSSTNYYIHSNIYSSSSSSTFTTLRSATSSLHVSKSNNPDYRSMQSLKVQQPPYQTSRIYQTPVARVSPLVNNQQSDYHRKDESWLSCEELETIEKRFTDLLQETPDKRSDQRAKSCDRLTHEDEHQLKPMTSTLSRKSLSYKKFDDDNQCPQTTLLSLDEVLRIESSFRSIGTQVYASRCLCELYITTAERLAKLEDWILFQYGSPVWLLDSGNHPKRQSHLSLILAEYGSGFPIWQDTINGHSDIKQAREQHITFRLSDKITLGVLRFTNLLASKEFFSYYISIRNDTRYKHLFSKSTNRSSSCGSILTNRKKLPQHVNKSSISNPCQFQHITSLQIKDCARLTSLNRCLMPALSHSNQLL
ncbi:unnamed protein product [Adineta ricciae]|uniref:Uncharacterized protein n=1 Tax=Adineta ricciae TaxID=249248 RepID=A0A815CDM4_ADIRI|nr:unnamed protein product [Adineta ricciae]CAF1282287.1 unnamed protein product [Adineta ricciae]